MKRTARSGLMALFLVVSSLAASPMVLGDAAGPAFTLDLVESSSSGLVYEFRLNWLDIVEDEAGQHWRLPGETVTSKIGAPELPAITRLLALPPQAGPQIEILEQEDTLLQGLYPAASAPHRREQEELSERADRSAPDVAYYEGGKSWPEEMIRLGEPALWLGARVCPLDVFPVMTLGADASLSIMTFARFRVNFSGGPVLNPGRERTVPEAFTNCVAAQVDNADDFRRWVETDVSRLSQVALGHYLVVIPDAALTGLNTWLDYKRRMGFRVTVLLKSEIGGTNPLASVIKAAIQEIWDADPFEYLLLVGDVDRTTNSFTLMSDFIAGGQYAEYTWNENIVTDHPYSLLEGDDYFSDVLVGRFSADNLTQLSTISSRCRLYEEAPPTGVDQEWFSRAIMIYDVAEAGSRRETKLSIRDQLLAIGYTQVDTIRNHQTNAVVSPTVVLNAVNHGASMINYRGFGYRYSWHGPNFGNEHIFQLSNYGRWPFVTSIVCGGGDFGSMYSDPCFGEAWLREGSVDEPTGAIAFIGPSEEDTHTMWNNAIDCGIYEGLTMEGLRTPGMLMQRGKTELWEVFPNDRQWSGPGASVPFYFHCYNLLGDPGLVLRTREPLQLVCDMPAQLPIGDCMFSLFVSDMDGNPVPEVTACLHNTETLENCIAVSDEQGVILLEPGELESGDEFHLTLFGQDMRGLSREVRVDTAASAIRVTKLVINDVCAGNSDSMANPGEEMRLSLDLVELGNVGLEGEVEIELMAPLGGVTFIDSLEIFEDGVAPGDTMHALDAFRIVLDETLCHGDRVPFDIYVNQSWVGRRNVSVFDWNFDVLDVRANVGELLPGANPLVEVQVLNSGAYGGQGLYALIEQEVDELDVVSGTLSPFDSEPDSASWCSTAELLIGEDLIAGMQVPLRLKMYGQGADPHLVPPLYETVFQLQLAGAEEGDPLGPDSFGHLILHSEDDSPTAPDFVWNDISDVGSLLDIEDVATEYWNDGEDGITRVIGLPFDFVYYGEHYDQVTVCSNGWIALGDREFHISGLNTPIPAAQGPPCMIAGYWCNLYNTYNNDRFGTLHLYYDNAAGEMTFQWTNWRPVGVGADVSFQIVLRDPQVFETSTGDGQILMYYNEVAYSNGRHGFTVGIENEAETEGLCYTFNNTYDEVCQEIEAGTALLVTSLGGYTDVEPAPALVDDFRMLGARPNPFNPVTQVSWEQPAAGDVSWALFNLRGQLVQSGRLAGLPAGQHELRVDLSTQSSGLYFMRLQAPGAAGVRRSANLRLLMLK